MKAIAFTKMIASGNDFVLIDAKSYKSCVLGSKLSAFAKEICDRKYGIGADGLIILENAKKANFKLRIFNPDGSEPSMCGNGARCAALFYSNQKPATPARHLADRKAGGSNQKKIKFETKAGVIEAEVKKGIVKLKMTEPKDLWANIDLNIGGEFYKVHYVNTGVPHAVFFVGNTDTINVKQVGRQIRFHKQFQPEGANANFAQIIDKRTIRVRTYERGVEDETLACGTGSAASALLAFYLKLTNKSPVNVTTKSQEVLKVYFDYKNNKFANVWLEGSARVVYNGIYYSG